MTPPLEQSDGYAVGLCYTKSDLSEFSVDVLSIARTLAAIGGAGNYHFLSRVIAGGLIGGSSAVDDNVTGETQAACRTERQSR